jgi:hypothetical protein
MTIAEAARAAADRVLGREVPPPAPSALPTLFELPPNHPVGVDLQTQIDATTEALERETVRYTPQALRELKEDGIVGHDAKVAGLRNRLAMLLRAREDRSRAEAHPRSWQRRWGQACDGALARAKYLFALELLAEPTEQALGDPNASLDLLRQRYVEELENVRFGSSPEQPRPRLVAEARARIARLEQRIRERENT